MNANGKIWVNAAAVAVGVAVANLTYRYLRRKSDEVRGYFCPLMDTVTVTTDGVKKEIMTFGYDDEERCTWARSLHLDSKGELVSEKLIEAEYYEDKILICEGTEELGDTPTITTMLLDEYGMVSSITTRHPMGHEERWDTKVNGAELVAMVSDEVKGELKWRDGNVESITYNNGVAVTLNYYNNVENHLFPDLNLLSEGLSADMLTTYLLGTRTRNFFSTAEHKMEDGSQKHISASYLCDHFDRPLQVVHEITEVDANGSSRKKQVVFDISYAG